MCFRHNTMDHFQSNVEANNNWLLASDTTQPHTHIYNNNNNNIDYTFPVRKLDVPRDDLMITR
jgi:hypothetical protein